MDEDRLDGCDRVGSRLKTGRGTDDSSVGGSACLPRRSLPFSRLRRGRDPPFLYILLRLSHFSAGFVSYSGRRRPITMPRQDGHGVVLTSCMHPHRCRLFLTRFEYFWLAVCFVDLL